MPLRTSILKSLHSFQKDFAVYNNIYISSSAILNNFDIFTKLSPGGYVIPVLKSNAYGHGLDQITTILKDRTFPYIAVDGYYESLKIHNISKQPTLVMGAIKSENYAKIKTNNNAFVVHDIFTLKAMAASKKSFKIHVEIETGMLRHGVRLNELDDFLNQIKKTKNLNLEGAMTHLADADNPESDEHVVTQTKRFDLAVEKIIKAGFKPKYIHIAQSAGSTKVRSRYANTLRVGLALYGISPLARTDKNNDKIKSIRPALTLTSTISKIIMADSGENVGYGRTFKIEHNSRIGVLPMGYYEGIPRCLSNVGQIKWENTYLPIVGRICMNHVMIDLGKTKTSVNDEVTIISNNPKERLSLENICKDNKLFNYGLLVGLNQNIRRTIVK